ncbi:MAG: sigma factor [Roseibacillus sp.]
MACGEPSHLDDLLQETLLRAVRYMRVFHDEAALWSWLTVLARSAVADHGRRRSRW